MEQQSKAADGNNTFGSGDSFVSVDQIGFTKEQSEKAVRDLFARMLEKDLDTVLVMVRTTDGKYGMGCIGKVSDISEVALNGLIALKRQINAAMATDDQGGLNG